MNTLFFELLQVALGSRKELHAIPTVSEWNEIFLQAERQTLIGIAFSGVECLPQEQRPPKELIYKWFSNTAWIEKQNLKKNHLCQKVQKTFLKYGFRTCILKGQGVAQYYDQPLRRQSGDIDIWIEGGWKKILNIVHAINPGGKVSYHHADCGYIKGVKVEAHFTPSWMFNPFKNRFLQKWFKSEEERQFTNKCDIKGSFINGSHGDESIDHPNVESLQNSDLQCVVSTDKFNVIYLLLHMYRHIFDDGLGLRQILDYYVLLKRTSLTESETKEMLHVIKKLGMMRFCRSMSWMLSDVFALDGEHMLVWPDEKSGRFLLEEVMQSGNFGKYDERMKLSSHEGRWHKFFRRQKRNMRFLRYYPDEVLWRPYFILYNLIWSKRAERFLY